MREMKDSGIEWIGEIPSSWELSKIGAVYEERNIKVSDTDYAPLSVTKNGIVPQLETAAKTDNGDNRKLIKKNDFVINSRSDRRGSCGISEYDGSCSLINTVLKPRKNMHNAYYDFVFHSDLFADEFFAWGNGIVDDLWSTKWSSMKRIYIPAPSLEEQKKIAEYLGAKCDRIDWIIETQEKTVEKLVAYRKAIISEVVTKGMNDNPNLVSSGDSWIGDIPQNWRVGKLGALFDFLGGYAFSSDDYVSETEYQVVRIGNVKNNYMPLESNPVFISEKIAEDAAKFEIKEGFILFTMTGTKGKRDYFYTHMVRKSDLEDRHLYINQRVGAFIARNNVCPGYYNYLLKNERILDSIFIYETGTANQGNLGIDSIRRTRVQIPPLEEQVEIAEHLDKKCHSIDSEIERKKILIDKLNDYKKSLIYEVVTGKKEV